MLPSRFIMVFAVITASSAAMPTFGTLARRAAGVTWNYNRCDAEFGPRRWPQTTGTKCIHAIATLSPALDLWAT